MNHLVTSLLLSCHNLQFNSIKPEIYLSKNSMTLKDVSSEFRDCISDVAPEKVVHFRYKLLPYNFETAYDIER